MTLTATSTSTLTLPVNVIFQQTFLRNARPKCPYFLGTAPATIERRRGTVSTTWRRIENITPNVTAITQVSTASYMQGRTPNTLSITDYTATASKYGDFVILNEEVDIENFSGQMDKIMQVIGIGYGRAANMLQRNIAEDNLTLVYPNGGSGDSGVTTAITLGTIKKVINTLSKNSAMTFTPMSTGSTTVGSAPITEGFIGLCHYDVAQPNSFFKSSQKSLYS